MKTKLNLKGFTTFAIKSGLLGRMFRREGSDLQEVLGRREAEDPKGSTWGMHGLAKLGPDDEDGNSEFARAIDGNCMMVMVQFNDRICPGANISEQMSEQVAAITEREGRKPNKTEMGQLRDDAEAFLLPRSHIRRTPVPVFIYDERIAIFTTSAKRANDVAALLFSIANDLGLHDVPLPASAVDSTRGWLTSVALSEDDSILEATSNVVLRYDATEEKKATLRIKDKGVHEKDIQDLINVSLYQASELGVVVLEGAETPAGLGGVEFTINDKLIIKGLKFPDLTIKTHLGDTDGDKQAELDGVITLVALAIPQIWDIVFDALGGEDRTAFEEDDEL